MLLMLLLVVMLTLTSRRRYNWPGSFEDQFVID